MRLLLVLILALLSPCAFGQNGAPAPAAAAGALPRAEPVTVAEINELRQRIMALEGADAAARDAGLRSVDTAAASLERAEQARARAEVYRQEAVSTPARIAEIRAELAAAPAATAPQPPAGATLDDLEAFLKQANAELVSARARSLELQNEGARRVTRQANVPAQLSEARLRVLEAEQALKTPLAPEDVSVVSMARRIEVRARRDQLTQEIEALEAELASYEARRELLPARLDLALRREAIAERAAAGWQGLVNAAREQAAREERRSAEQLRERVKSHPGLESFAEESRQLSLERTGGEGAPGLIGKIRQADTAVREARAGFAALRAQYGAVYERIQVAGLTRSTGIMLRRQYEQLPDPNSIERELRAVRRSIDEIEYSLIERKDARRGAGDINSIATTLLDGVRRVDPGVDERLLRDVTTELAVGRRDVLDALIADAEQYRQTLYELESVLTTYEAVARLYLGYIEERILWVRSVPGDASWFGGATLAEARELTRAGVWAEVVGHAWRGNGDGAAVLPMVGLTWLLTLVGSRLARRRLVVLNGYVARFRTDRFGYSLEATALAAVRTLPLPLLLAAVGWLLARPAQQLPHGVALGTGLVSAAVTAFPLVFWAGAVRPRGYCESHLRWSPAITGAIRARLRWLVPVLLACTVVVSGAEWSPSEVLGHSAGRIAFSVGMLGVSVFFFGLLRPGRGALREYFKRNATGVIARTHLLWGPLLVLAPVVLMVLAWLGWYYTALQLERRAELTLVLLLFLVLVYGLAMRWLYVARRRVAVEDARRRREQAATEPVRTENGPGVPRGESTVQTIDEDKVDLPGLSAQSKQVFTTGSFVAVAVGVYLIWASALPALRMLERVEVWPTVRVVEASGDDSIEALERAAAAVLPADRSGAEGPMPATPDVDGPERAESGEAERADEPDPEAVMTVTLADIGLALVVVTATILAFRNLPGFVEIVLLQRLPLDAGARYALSTVLRYAIAVAGTVVALNAINLAWSNVQWLAAALTFGLGFGLQEIFANFISGLIILAERPVRVGDTVTVGGVTGTVTRIRMRATTISDWDRKELIIPNKNFITGDVINWTLSDPVLRVILPVGVSYGSDVDLVEQILYRVSREHPIVLSDPGPQVLFKSFGDSTLDFELRFFIPHIDHFVRLRHDMHIRIIKAFREADIEIAFPQRDLHVRSVEGLSGLVPPAAARRDDG